MAHDLVRDSHRVKPVADRKGRPDCVAVRIEVCADQDIPGFGHQGHEAVSLIGDLRVGLWVHQESGYLREPRGIMTRLDEPLGSSEAKNYEKSRLCSRSRRLPLRDGIIRKVSVFGTRRFSP